MANARAKAEQADQIAMKAEQDSDAARLRAKEFAPEFHQPGMYYFSCFSFYEYNYRHSQMSSRILKSHFEKRKKTRFSYTHSPVFSDEKYSSVNEFCFTQLKSPPPPALNFYSAKKGGGGPPPPRHLPKPGIINF